MDEAELVHTYLHQQFNELVGKLYLIFERQPALAVRMVRGEVELYERLVRSIARKQEAGDQCDLDDLERHLREDRDW